MRDFFFFSICFIQFCTPAAKLIRKERVTSAVGVPSIVYDLFETDAVGEYFNFPPVRVCGEGFFTCPSEYTFQPGHPRCKLAAYPTQALTLQFCPFWHRV